MANADNIATVFSAQLLKLFRQINVWPSLARDYSSEISMFGDTIKIPGEESSTVTAANVTKTQAQSETLANHEWGDPNIISSTDVDLVIDKYKRINELVPGVQIDQLRFDLVTNAAERSATTWANEYNDNIRDEMNKLAASRRVGTAVSVTAANFAGAQAAFLDALLLKFSEAALQADYEFWPDMGRWSVVSARVYDYIIRELESRNYHFASNINDTMIAGHNLMMYKGWALVKDASQGDGVTNTDDGKHTMFFGVQGHGLATALQTRKVRAFDSEVQDGVRIQGRQQYGAVINQPSKLLRGDITIT